MAAWKDRNRPIGTSRVVAAIDFGTKYTGYAYWLERGGRDIDAIDIVADKSWSEGGRGMQAPTTVLMDPENEFHSFGREAERTYESQRLLGEHTKWHYFRHIKLALRKVKKLDRFALIFDAEGNPLPAQQVFAFAIEYTKKHIEQRIKNEFGNRYSAAAGVHWVITVPPEWNGPKHFEFIKAAATTAGIKHNLYIVSEAEAAIVFYKNIAKYDAAGLDRKFISSVGAGNYFLVLDLGADIADATVFYVDSTSTRRREDEMKLEAKDARQGTRSAERVNIAFEEFLETVLGKECVAEIKQKQGKDWIELKKAFGNEKLHFSLEDIEKNRETVITLPPAFKPGDFSQKLALKRVERKAKISNNCLVLSPILMKKFFEAAIDDIKQFINGLLSENTFPDICCILVIGGFAESPVVRHELQSFFPKRTFIPEFSSLAVLKGAVIYGKGCLDTGAANTSDVQSTPKVAYPSFLPSDDDDDVTDVLTGSEVSEQEGHQQELTTPGRKDDIKPSQTQEIQPHFTNIMEYQKESASLSAESEVEIFDAKLRAYLEEGDLSKLGMVTEMLSKICLEIKEREGANAVQVYPSYKLPGRWKPIFVILEMALNPLITETYRGWSVVRRRFDRVDSEAAEIALSDEVQQSRMDFAKMEDIAKAMKRSNLSEHNSNVTYLTVCTCKKIHGVIQRKDCIVVCCFMKDYIPFDEEPLPTSLSTENFGEISIDVREGFCADGMHHPSSIPRQYYHPQDSKSRSYNGQLLMGTEIRIIDQNASGTLGGFVKSSDGGIGFLTCAHVVNPQCDQNPRLSLGKKVVQPGYCSLHNDSCLQSRVCGKVEKCLLQYGSVDAVSVDAAMVKVEGRQPNIGKFVFVNDDDLSFAGYGGHGVSIRTFPQYSGRTLEKLTGENLDKVVLKIGKESGLTRGFINFIQATSKTPTRWQFSLPMLDNTTPEREVSMYNQFEICSLRGYGAKPFAIKGDSGALVFQDINGDLQCIGMVVGVTQFDSVLVTPIEHVLKAVGVSMCVIDNN